MQETIKEKETRNSFRSFHQEHAGRAGVSRLTQTLFGLYTRNSFFSVGFWETRLGAEFLPAHLPSVVLSANVKCRRKTQNFSCAGTTRVLHKQPTTHRMANTWQNYRKVESQKALPALTPQTEKKKKKKTVSSWVVLSPPKARCLRGNLQPRQRGNASNIPLQTLSDIHGK